MSLIYPDYRMGGVVNYVVLKEGERLMRLPDKVRECVIFMGVKEHGNDDPTIGATAFFLSTPFKEKRFKGQRHKYVITAKHNLKEFDEITCDDIVWLRCNLEDVGSEWIPTDRGLWISHPETDLAILPINFITIPDGIIDVNAKMQHHMIYSESIADDYQILNENIGIGDEVVAIGLFTHHKGQGKNLPMVRSGIIAGMPEEKVYTDKTYKYIDAYLVEIRSIGGFSGSPVFVYLGGPPIPIPMTKNTVRVYERMIGFDERTFYLLGLLHGHWDVKESQVGFSKKKKMEEGIGTGMAVVVPATKIIELINEEKIQKMERDYEEQKLDEISTIPDSALDEGITKEKFEESFKKVSQPIPPDEEKKET